MMKKIFYFIGFTVFMGSFFSCSIQNLAYNAIAPSPEKKLASQERALKLAEAGKEKEGDPILALTSEDDIELVADFFPFALKFYEMLYFNNPKHEGVALMTGQLYVMYANAFVEKPAKYMSDEFYDKKDKELFRAKKFYLRGSDYVLKGLNMRFPGFSENVFSLDENTGKTFLEKCKKHDADALFWTASGILGAFALDPIDSDVVEKVDGALLMLERITEIMPEYNNGGVWEVLTAFYAVAPEGLGGSMEKAEKAYKNALKYSNGGNASTFVTFATSFCIPKQDSKGFDEALDKALAINPDDYFDNRLMVVLAQNDARWLKENKNEFIFE